MVGSRFHFLPAEADEFSPSSLGAGCLGGSWWIPKAFARMDRPRRLLPAAQSPFWAALFPNESHGTPWVLSNCSSKLCVCKPKCFQDVHMYLKHTLAAFYMKFCLKTFWSPWIFYHHHQESILHLHFYAGTYIFKTLHVPLIACVLYGPDRKPRKNDCWILSGFHGHRMKPVLNSHSSIPHNSIFHEKICIGRLNIS